MLVQSPSGVPCTHVRTWSIAAEAAEAAEEAPRAPMISAPRFWTFGMKVSRYQASSTRSAAGAPATVHWLMSGYCVAEWLPQMVMRRISVACVPVFSASWLIARLWSRRVMAANCRRSSLGRSRRR